MAKGIIEEVVNKCRLEQHFYHSVIPTQMILNYTHTKLPNNRAEAFTALSIEDTYMIPIAALPTLQSRSPTRFLTTTIMDNADIGAKRGRQFNRVIRNPIDYTAIRDHILRPKKLGMISDGYIPTLEGLPRVLKVSIKIWDEDAVASKSIVLSAIMALQSITTSRPDPLFATIGDSTKRIRVGMPMGAHILLRNEDMYNFIDKTVQCVLPRIPDWKGVPPNFKNGNVTMKLPASSIGINYLTTGYFPDIEPHFDMFPKMFDLDVTFHTTAKNEREAILCLSGFQIPFQPKFEAEELALDEKELAWEEMKNAKTRAERKAIAVNLTPIVKAKMPQQQTGKNASKKK